MFFVFFFFPTSDDAEFFVDVPLIKMEISNAAMICVLRESVCSCGSPARGGNVTVYV